MGLINYIILRAELREPSLAGRRAALEGRASYYQQLVCSQPVILLASVCLLESLEGGSCFVQILICYTIPSQSCKRKPRSHHLSLLGLCDELARQASPGQRDVEMFPASLGSIERGDAAARQVLG